MKRLILFTTCALCLFGCGGPPAAPNRGDAPTDISLPTPTIKVYLENSGSMDGYVNGATDFENAVYSYLSDLQHAKLGLRADSLSAKNMLILNYINSEVLQQSSDVREFIEALEPTDFRIRGGKRGISDMSNIIDTIVSQTGANDVSILISDCIFSPGRKYKARDNADEYIVAQQIGIKSHLVEKLVQDPDFSIVVLRLLSQFNGSYFNKFDDSKPINDTRPFYIWLMGDRAYLKTILKEVNVERIKGGGVQNVFMVSNPSNSLQYRISLPQPGNGEYDLDRVADNTIVNAQAEVRNGETRFQVDISVDYSNILLPEEYLMNPDNYLVSNRAYGIEVCKYSGPNKNKYTHTIRLILKQPSISRGTVRISLNNSIPQWVNDYSDDDGLDISAPGAMEKTYGLKYLLGGVYDAYSSNKQFGSITINIK